MMTFESASPGTSTPCQKLSVPKRTLLSSALELGDHRAAVEVRALLEQAEVVLGQPVPEPGGHLLEHLVAREQDEGPAGRLEQVFLEHLGGVGDEVGIVRVRQARSRGRA